MIMQLICKVISKVKMGGTSWRTGEVENGLHDGLPDLPRTLRAAVGVQEHQQLARPVAALPDGGVQRRCPVANRLC